MKKVAIAMGLLLLVTDGSVWAQGGGGSAGGSSGRSPSPSVQAPIGHRQPRPGDLPDEKNLANPNDQTNKEDAALDRKIKSICRGC